jgi:hypothetical protein
MPEPDNTEFLLNLFQTRSMFKWLFEFFRYSRNGVAQGWFDEDRVFDQFKNKILESKPTTFLGSPIKSETVDWRRLYDECKELTQPADWKKKSLRAELERRGIDPTSFGWDLSNGEEVNSGEEPETTEAKQLIKQDSVVKVQFQNIRNLQQVTNGLASQYKSQVGAAGPVIGVLWMRAHLHEVDSPPALSPVEAHLVEMSFGTFEDLHKQLRTYRKRGIEHFGKVTYEAWTRNILDLAADSNTLLALSVALLTEGQMTAISSSAQDILLRFLAPILETPSAPLRYKGESGYLDKAPNAEVVGILHAGQVPFLIACHPSNTLSRWWSHLEAAMVLLIPQVIVAVEAVLSPDGREIMFSALAAEVRRWKHSRPRLGEVVQWEWLPKLM